MPPRALYAEWAAMFKVRGRSGRGRSSLRKRRAGGAHGGQIPLRDYMGDGSLRSRERYRCDGRYLAAVRERENEAILRRFVRLKDVVNRVRRAREDEEDKRRRREERQRPGCSGAAHAAIVAPKAAGCQRTSKIPAAREGWIIRAYGADRPNV